MIQVFKHAISSQNADVLRKMDQQEKTFRIVRRMIEAFKNLKWGESDDESDEIDNESMNPFNENNRIPEQVIDSTSKNMCIPNSNINMDQWYLQHKETSNE